MNIIMTKKEGKAKRWVESQARCGDIDGRDVEAENCDSIMTKREYYEIEAALKRIRSFLFSDVEGGLSITRTENHVWVAGGPTLDFGGG